MSQVSRRGLLSLRLRDPEPPPDYEEASRCTCRRWAHGAEPYFRALEPLAAPVCDAASVGSGDELLDVGAGDGNVAREAARRGASVTACDPVPAMEGVDVAPASALPYADASFDAVVSVLGAMLDPRPRRTARELLRVLRPGGTLVLAIPSRRSLTARALRMGEALPDRVRSPLAWTEPIVADSRFPGLAVERREVALERTAGWEALAGPFGLPPGGRDRFADIAAAHPAERWQLLVVRRP